MRSWLSAGSGYGLRRDREQVRNLMTNFCKNVQLLFVCVCVLFEQHGKKDGAGVDVKRRSNSK